ncbi:hypothetical protein BJ165DRAFT_1317789, partial [Panaeolus papilionaceus]
TPISIVDLQQHTHCGGLYSSSHPTIRAFWNVVDAFSEDEKKSLLRFDAGLDETRLPTASHTCVNLLKM